MDMKHYLVEVGSQQQLHWPDLTAKCPLLSLLLQQALGDLKLLTLDDVDKVAEHV